MALVEIATTAALLCIFGLTFGTLGSLILHTLRIELAPSRERLIVCMAVGILTFEILIFLVQLTQHIRFGIWTLSGLLLIILTAHAKSVWEGSTRAFRTARDLSRPARLILLFIAIVAFVELLISMAPVTGSDALHYHFAVQKQILEHGFHPIFSNSHSFLCGQHHLLILVGLAFGSDRLAMGFIFLGGVLTAAALISLAYDWSSQKISAAFGLLFLLTPVVFWQMASSGAPDIFMAFLTCTGLLVLRQEYRAHCWRRVVLAGFLVGGAAGAKYTGILVVVAFAVALVIEFHSMSQMAFFVAGSLLSGIWPYLRNLVWTGNPVFPFLSPVLSPHLVTTVALANLASDTGRSSVHHLAQLFPFAFLAAAQNGRAGLWDFFGPTVLALAPLLLLSVEKKRGLRLAVLVWLFYSTGVFFASGLPRFLLPVFPIALSCVAAGAESAFHQSFTMVRRTAIGLLTLMMISGAVGLAVYARKPVLSAVGIVSKNKYLRQTSQDYEVAEAVNHLLSGELRSRRVLVFIRHTYYLRVPFMNGDPATSFEIDTTKLRTSRDWHEFFDKENVGYVVRSPIYPASIATALTEMENHGDLICVAETEVRNLQGMRVDQKSSTVQVLVFAVNRKEVRLAPLDPRVNGLPQSN